MKPILLGSLCLLSGASMAFGNVSFKDWSYEKVITSGETVCQAYTETVNPEGYTGVLQLNFPVGKDAALPSIEVQLSGLSLENGDIKAALGASNASSIPTDFVGLEPQLSRQDFFVPVAEGEQLVGDVIADRFFNVEFLNFSGNVVTSLDFSLSGSSATIRGMAQDCMGLSGLSRPYPLSQFLTDDQLELSEKILTAKSTLNNSAVLDSEDYYAQAALLQTETSELSGKNATHKQASEALDVSLQTQARLEGLKDRLIQKNATLTEEKLNLLDAEPKLAGLLVTQKQSLSEKESELLDIKAKRDDLGRELASLKSLQRPHKQKVGDLNSEIRQLESELAAIRSDLASVSNARVRKQNHLQRTRAEIRRLDSAVDKANKEQRLQRRRQELNTAQNRLNRFDVESQVRTRTQREAAGLRQELSQARGALQTATRAAQSKRQEIAQLTQRKLDLESQVVKGGANDNMIRRLEAEKRNNLNRSAELNKQRQSAHNRRQQLDRQLQQCDRTGPRSRCDNLRLQRAKEVRKIDNIDSENKDLAQRRTAIDRQVAQLKRAPKGNPQAERELRQVEQRLAQARRSLRGLESSERSAQSRVSQLQQQVNNVENKVRREVRSEKNDLENRVSNLRRRVRDLREDIERTDRKIGNLRNEARVLRVEIQDLEATENSLILDEQRYEKALADARYERDQLEADPSYRSRKIQIANVERDKAFTDQLYTSQETLVVEARQDVRETELKIQRTPQRLQAIDDELASGETRVQEITDQVLTLEQDRPDLDADQKSSEKILTEAIQRIASLSLQFKETVISLLP